MGFLDKVKAGAEQAKELAEKGAERAKQEAKELQLKRDIGQTEGELGKVVLDLAERGQLSHPEIDPLVAKAKSLKAQLAAVQAGGAGAGTEAPAAGEPPAGGSEPAP